MRLVLLDTALVLLALSSFSARGEDVPLSQGWDYAEAMRKVAAKGSGRAGVVLHVGDSITYANPYGAWARDGKGRTAADLAALKWMHAGARDDTDGWYLASFDHPDGGRSHTACGGLRADELLAGGKQGMPSLAEILDRYTPQAAVVMVGTNDASAGRTVDAYRRDMEAVVEAMASRGVVPIVSTIPPHVHRQELARSYNEALREIARRRGLPLIDFEREILARRPRDWDGTLLNRGDVHPTAESGGTGPASEPTKENVRNSGYLLRGWLSVKKITEVKRAVFDKQPK
ncbi:MAG TPA: SGNH/GDSL hydrolase family protein [Tepidisphaeraceae bacterium]|nr:SGNH/GDSL hydrolase family protein [Tepidisphaeraceae bacterium]